MKKYLLITCFIFVFIFNISIILSSVRNSCLLFFNKVFISVFPFMILSDILFYFDYHIFIRDSFVGKIISKLFNIDSYSSTVFIFSILTSQPNNAVYIKNMLDNGCINEDDASRLIVFTYFPSMFFVIGVIGVLMYNSLKIGLLLYLNCLFNNILIGLFYRKKYVSSKATNIKIESNIFSVIKTSISKSINNCYIILGNLIIFNIILDLISHIFNFDITLISIILEFTSGLTNILNLNISLSLKLILTSFCINFSGLSILFQSFSILSNYNLNIKKILITKLIFSLISSIHLVPILLLN